MPHQYHSIYIKGIRVGISASDANDFLNTILLNGLDFDSVVAIKTLDHDGIKGIGIGEFTHAFTAEDCSAYDRITLSLLTAFATTLQLGIRSVLVDMYYDT